VDPSESDADDRFARPPLPELTHVAASVEAGVVVATFPGGRFDGNAVRDLFELAMALPTGGAKLLVDTAGVAFVPSGGMGILVMIRKRFLSSGGQLHITLPDPRVRESFDVARMGRLLSLFDSCAAAREAFK